MKKDLLNFIAIGIRVLIGLSFIYAGFNKILDIETFKNTIGVFGLLPASLIYPTAVILPLLEIVFGVGMVLGNKESVYAVLLLLLLFIFVLVFGIYKGIDVDCGCYGAGDSVGDSLSSLRTSLLRDMVMILGIIFTEYYRSFKRAVNRLKD